MSLPILTIKTKASNLPDNRDPELTSEQITDMHNSKLYGAVRRVENWIATGSGRTLHLSICDTDKLRKDFMDNYKAQLQSAEYKVEDTGSDIRIDA